MAITLTIGGIDFTENLEYRTLQVETTQEIKGSTLSFEMYFYDNYISLLTGKEVILKDGATIEFGGVVVRTREFQHEAIELYGTVVLA